MTKLEKLVEEFAQNVAAQTDAIFRGDTSAEDEHAARYIAALKDWKDGTWALDPG
ncbi:MAG TPA: hypothetical protein VNA24_21760 [Hyalangium sp.]|nr:hypothetical protein [Hyalangium sp.]